MPSVSALEAEALPPIGAHLPAGSRRNVASLVMLGIFVTTFAQDAVFALYPIRHLFSHMGYDATAIAAFGRTAALAWYFKPVIGIFTDCFPLFRTRRKSYLLIGSLAGAVLWAAFAFVPQKYSYYLWLMVGVNLALVIGSAASGGLLVEEGQRSGATGGLSSIRYAVMNGASLIAGPVGGFLVIRTFHDTAYAGAAFCALLFFATLFMLHEPVAPGIDRSASATPAGNLKPSLPLRFCGSPPSLRFSSASRQVSDAALLLSNPHAPLHRPVHYRPSCRDRRAWRHRRLARSTACSAAASICSG